MVGLFGFVRQHKLLISLVIQTFDQDLLTCQTKAILQHIQLQLILEHLLLCKQKIQIPLKQSIPFLPFEARRKTG